SSFLVDDAGVPQVVINPWLDDLLLLILVITVVATASLTYSRIEKPWREYGRFRIKTLTPSPPAYNRSPRAPGRAPRQFARGRGACGRREGGRSIRTWFC